MKTQAQAVAWLQAQIGQHLDYDHQYGQQCSDFFNYYYQFLTSDNPFADGYGVSGAKDIWNVPKDTQFFIKIPNSNSLVPQPGDVAIYGASWGAGYGHVEVCLSSDGNGSWFVGENEHDDPSEGVVKVYRTWAQMNGLLGVMRPKWTTNPPEGGDEVLDLQTAKDLANMAAGRDPSDPNNIADLNKNHVGHNALTDIQGWYGSKERAEYLANQQTTVKNLQDKIADLTSQLAQADDDNGDLKAKVDNLTAANLKLTDQLQTAKNAPVTDDQAAQVVATKANPLVSFLSAVWQIIKKGGSGGSK